MYFYVDNNLRILNLIIDAEVCRGMLWFPVVTHINDPLVE